MTIEKRSFISDLIGRNIYDDCKNNAKWIVAIGTCLLLVFFPLTFVCHWELVSAIFSLITGGSLLFIIYVAAFILLLDIEVDAEVPDKWNKPASYPTSIFYRLTIVWGIVLVALGITAIIITNNYRKHYAFQCETVYVDNAGIVHLYEDCDYAGYGLEKMKGYETEQTGYELCDACEESAEEAEQEPVGRP